MNKAGDQMIDETNNSKPFRTAAPIVRATVVIGTIVAFVAAVGAPFKWY